MTIETVKEILNGTFSDESDKEYWEKKLRELERKEKISKENEIYFNKMIVYNR